MEQIPVDDGPALGKGVSVTAGAAGDPPTSRSVVHETTDGTFLHVEGTYELDPYPDALPPWAYRWVEERDCWRTTDDAARYRVAAA